MALTDIEIRGFKPGQSDRKYADKEGLFLLVTKSGSKLWRFKYRIHGKEKKLAFGQYPEVSLSDARKKREKARALLEEGRDPAQVKREKKISDRLSHANNFDAVGREFIDKMEREDRAAVTLSKARWLLSQFKPAIGTRPIAEIKPFELLDVLKKVEAAGKRETASRMRAFASRVFRYAVATTRAESDPAQLLVGALTAPNVKHHAAIIDPKALGGLLRAIEGYVGQPATMYALRLTPHVFQRPGEVRQMEWAEIDFDAAVWAIPAARMKMRQPHHVPLSRQAVEVLREMHKLTGKGKYVFPSVRSPSRPMSENTINGALRRLGYTTDEMTAHGFRTTASSLLNESGRWNPDAIERALAHKDSDAVRGAYHRANYWRERVEMAQWWSDYLDGLRDGAKILPFKDGQGAA